MKAAAVLVSAVALQAAAPLATISSPLNDYNLSFDSAERIMVFARSEAEFRNARIFIAQRSDRSWSTPVPISFSDDRYSDSDPWLTPDGQTLYFISDRPAAGREEDRVDYDIWRSSRIAGGWSEPERLGPEVNGRGHELGPEVHQGVLYFSSARRGELGGLDIYRAEQKGSSFGPATLLDGPFNTAVSESDFTLSPDGRSAMFWRASDDRGIIHIARLRADGWHEPAPLPAHINTGPFNFTPSFSRDGRRVRYATTAERPGQPSGLADVAEARLPSR